MSLPVMPASMLLDARTDLLARLDDDLFSRQVSYMVATQSGDFPANGVTTDYKAAELAVHKHRHAPVLLGNHVRAAEVYRVSPDMSSMVQFAASQLDDSDLIDTSLPPTQCGIVRFDQPLPVKEIRGKTMLVNWFVWGPATGSDGRSGIALWAFNDAISSPDDIHLQMKTAADEAGRHGDGQWYDRFVGRFSTIGIDLLHHGEPLGPEMQPPSPSQMLEVLSEGVDQPSMGTNTMRYAHALWLLLNQTVTKIEDERAERPARRRAEKAKLPSAVTVIRLRREVSTLDREPGESQIEWQHRWIVRGHWRWQACGVGRTERRRIWINPFIKGPEGAPIKQSEKVYSLDR